MVGRDGGWRDDDLGAERLEELDLLAAHLVGDREDASVPLDGRGEGEADAGVAAGPLDDDAAGLEATLAFGGLDDRRADPVLDRAAGVEELRLDVDGSSDPLGHAVQADERRPADRLQDVVVCLLVAHGSRRLVHWRIAPGAPVAELADREKWTGRRTHAATRSSPRLPGLNRMRRAASTAAESKAACPLE